MRYGRGVLLGAVVLGLTWGAPIARSEGSGAILDVHSERTLSTNLSTPSGIRWAGSNSVYISRLNEGTALVVPGVQPGVHLYSADDPNNQEVPPPPA